LHPSHLGTAGTVGAKLGLSLLAAVVSYVVVEQPVRRGWPHGRVAPALGAFGMMVAATALVVGTRGALPPAPSAPTDGLPPHVAGAPVVWVAGDSVALSLAANLHDDPARFGVNPLERTQLGCTVVGADRPMRSFAGDPIAPPPCATRALEGIDAVRPDVVVLWVGSRPNDAIEVDGRWVRACDPAFDDAHREATAELARRLQASGAQVVISTVLRSGARSLPVAGSEERIACVNRAIGEAADLVEGAVVIDPNELLCPDDAPCVESLAGGPVRSDGLHLDRGPGGAQVAAWMIEQALGSTANASLAPDLQARLAAIPERTLAWLDRVTTLAQGVEMDDEGLRYWGERLVLGDARVAVAEALVSSEAWRHQRVVEAHRRWLGTDPDEATERRWTSWLATHTTSELDLALATSEEGEAASGTTHRERAQHLADALALPEAAVDHFEARLDRGVEWDTVVRDGYFSLPASDQRMVGLAPSSPYTPPTEQLIAEFRTTGDERAPLVQALATTP
ncbi:MAG: SGNH/GDSL hydrolase family protein, partial [Acidimicrobiales bacterium]|nr:SGNH/GDSL hydrolase family protein [Acidimicrobiales bacterium]